MTRRQAIVVGLCLLGAILWVAGAWWLVPRVIGEAYRDESFAFLNARISGQATHTLDDYLRVWAGYRATLTLVLVAAMSVALGLAFWGSRLAALRDRVAGRVLGPNPRILSFGWLAVYAIAFGLALGLLEFGGSRLHSLLAERPPWPYSSFVLWLAPLANALALLGLVLVLSPLLLRWPKLRSPLVVLFGFGLLGFYMLFRVTFPGLHTWAVGLLSVGLSVQLASLGQRRAPALDRLMPRAAVALGSLVAILFAADRGARFLRERAGLADAEAGAPNVLMLMLDTVRARNLSLYGYERSTSPELEQFAETGVVFERAIATSSWTLPSHVSVFTGRYPHEVSASWTRPFDSQYPTLAEVLRARGYRTGAFFANLFFGDPYFGLDRGFGRFESKFINLRTLVEDSWILRSSVASVRNQLERWVPRDGQTFIRLSAADMNSRVLDFVARDATRPFFAFANYFDAHDPFVPPEPFDTLFWPERPRGWYWPDDHTYSAAESAELEAAYDASIAYLDLELGRLFDELERRGVLRNTIVIIVGDHGEEFGRRGFVGHGNTLYGPTIRVPLIISWPGRVPAGLRVDEAVSIREVPETLLDLLGHDARDFPGHSLASAWEIGAETDSLPGYAIAELFPDPTDTNLPDRFPLNLGVLRSVVMGDFQLIMKGNGELETWDLTDGGYEARKPEESPRLRAMLPRLQLKMDSLKRFPIVPES